MEAFYRLINRAPQQRGLTRYSPHWSKRSHSCELMMSLTQAGISSVGLCFDNFHTFMGELSHKQDTIHFWYQFVTVDIMAYFGLFIAIRYRNWDLRNSSIKPLAPVFSAFDRPIYQSLIPRHIFDVLSLPDCVRKHLQQGCVSVRLSGTEWHFMSVTR